MVILREVLVRYSSYKKQNNNRTSYVFFIAACLGMVGFFAYYQTPKKHSGYVQVIDGDSLRVNGVEVRLLGIDAPEVTQICSFNGADVKCGRDAARHLAGLINGRNTTCHEKEKDIYGRALSRCYIGEIDLAQSMVKDGYAVSFGDYVKNEAEARASKKGIWAMEFERPKDYRVRKRALQ